MKLLTLATGEAHVRVQSNHPKVLDAVQSMFPDYTTREDASSSHSKLDDYSVDRDSKDRFTVRQRVGQHGEALLASALPWPELVVHLEHLVAERLLLGHTSALHLHGGGVELEGVGVLLLGPSGAGKSTVSIALARDGAPLLGDDVVLLRAHGFAEAFRRRPKLDVSQARRLGINPPSTILWDPDADECWLDPNEWSGWSAPVPVGLVARLSYSEGSECTAERMTPAEALAELVASLFPSGTAPENPLPEELTALAGNCPAFRLRYGEVEDALAAIREARRRLPAAQPMTGV